MMTKLGMIGIIGILLLSQLTRAQYGYGTVAFRTLPQSLLLSPADEYNGKTWFAIPFLGGFNAQVYGKNLTMDDFFSTDKDFYQTMQHLIQSKSKSDYIFASQELNILYGGFSRSNRNWHNLFSYGISEKVQQFTFMLPSWMSLAIDGNSETIGQKYQLSEIRTRTDVFATYHFGASIGKLNSKWRYGFRFKLYNSLATVQMTNNSGYIVTNSDDKTGYKIEVDGKAKAYAATPLLRDDPSTITPTEAIKALFMGGNWGIGSDLGFNYKPQKERRIYGSIIDLGQIWYRKGLQTYSFNTEYVFKGASADKTGEQWKEEITNAFQPDTVAQPFSKPMNTRFILGWEKTHLGDIYKIGSKGMCPYPASPEELYQPDESIGFFFQGIFLAKHFAPALTIYYYRNPLSWLQYKLWNSFSEKQYLNLGAEVSIGNGPIQFFIGGDNLTGYINLNKTKGESIQFGINWLMGRPYLAKK